MILALTSALISTWVLGRILPVALTFCTIRWRATFAVCTTRGLAPRLRTAANPTMPATTTIAAPISRTFFFLMTPRSPSDAWA